MTEAVLVEQSAGAKNFHDRWRSITRSLWNGVWSYDQSFDFAQQVVRNGLTQAWYEGAKKVGLAPADMTPEERIELERIIFGEFTHIDGFLAAIDQGSKANGGKLAPLMKRADLWIGRYEDVVSRAELTGRDDPKLQWQYGDTQHCDSCLRLAGKTKRASFWKRAGVHPRAPRNEMLQCLGFNCQCVFVPIDEKCTPGPLPRLP